MQTAIVQTEKQIALICEYRTRLIADVVTGKLDVRAAAAALPDEVPLEPAEAESDGPEQQDQELAIAGQMEE